jgi:hypothetical protein
VGVFSRFEGGLDSAFDRAAGAVFRAPIEPAQIAKRAEKQMNREKLVGAGKQYAPTLYTVLVNADDNRKLFGFYPTMAAEIETYLMGKGTQNGLKFDGRPLVRFIVDDKLKSGRFDVIAETVAAPLIAKLRDEEMEFYGLKESSASSGKATDAEDEPGIAGASAVLPPVGAKAVSAGAALGAAGAGRAAAGAAAVSAGAAAGAAAVSAGAGAAGAAAGRRQSARGSASRGRHSGPLDGAARRSGPLDAGAAAGAARAAGASAARAAGASAGAARAAGASAARAAGASAGAAGARSDTPDAATGAAVGRARLTNHHTQKSYALTRATMTLGRDVSCDIALDDANVSRRHARLSQDVVGTWKLTDLNSTNGTLLNGKPITSALLRNGDEIATGMTVLEFWEGQ